MLRWQGMRNKEKDALQMAGRRERILKEGFHSYLFQFEVLLNLIEIFRESFLIYQNEVNLDKIY